MKRFIVLSLTLLLTLAACSIDESGSNEPLRPGEAMASFTVNLPAPSSDPASYALAINDESKIETYHVFAFKSNKLVDFARHNQIEEGTTPKFNVKFKKLTLNENYTFVVLANAETQFEALASNYVEGADRETLMAKFLLNEGGTTQITRIPMWGEVEVKNLTNNHAVSGLTLLRMMAKINIKVDGTAKSKFKLASAHLYNYYPDGRIAPSGGQATTPTLTGTARVTSKAIDYTIAETFEHNFSDKIYTFEADVPMSGSSVDMGNLHCLIIGGIYTGDSSPTYYRLNIIDKDANYLPLLRNNSYTMTIDKVEGRGYSSKEAALAVERMTGIEASLLVWNDSNTSIEYDGTYTLSVEKKAVEFYKEASAVQTGTTLSILTNCDTWTATSNAPLWLTVKEGTNSITLEFDATTAERTGTITIKAGDRLQTEITVRQINAVMPVAVTGVAINETAAIALNSYSSPSATLTTTITPTSATEKGLIWSSNNNAIATVDQTGKVTAGTSPGTATITATAKDGSGKTASKAIVVTIGNLPAAHKGWAGSNIYWDEANNRLTFDDVNVKTNEGFQGVYFQWGSLTGIAPNGNYVAGSTVIYPSTGGKSVSGPWALVTRRVDDTSIPQNRNRAYLLEIHNEAAGIGDICKFLTDKGWAPGTGKRWRMPVSSEFGVDNTNHPFLDFTTGTNPASTADGKAKFVTGRRKDNESGPFFPASGYRSSSNGVLINVGAIGDYWSSSPNDTYGRNLNFGSGGVNPAIANHRAYGFPVRCVQE